MLIVRQEFVSVLSMMQQRLLVSNVYQASLLF